MTVLGIVLIVLLDKRNNALDKTGRILLSCPVATSCNDNLIDLLIKLVCLIHCDLSKQTHLTTQRGRWNLELAVSLQHGLVVLCIMWEGAVQVEASSHCTRLTETGAVMFDISGTDTCRVEAESVVEMLDVDLFFSLGEQLGQVELLLEREVPHSR
jgi:hypothetical protein